MFPMTVLSSRGMYYYDKKDPEEKYSLIFEISSSEVESSAKFYKNKKFYIGSPL